MRGTLFLFCLLSLSVGILLGRFAGPVLNAGLLILSALFCLYVIRSGKDFKRFVLIAFLFLASGLIVSSFAFFSMSGAVAGHAIGDGCVVKLTGTVKSEPHLSCNREYFILQCEHIEMGRRKWRSKERLNVVLEGENKNISIFPGVMVSAEGKVSCEQDSSDWLETRGAVAELHVNSGSISVIGEADFISRCIESMRNWLKDGIDSVFEKNIAGLVKGYSIGYKADIKDATLEDLDKCGLSHIVAVSGLHIGTTAVIISWLLCFAGFGKKAGIVSAIIIAILIVSISGFRPSAVRSAIMVSAAFGGVLAGRRFNGFSGVGIAGIVILALNPRVLFDIGFQYSFSAVIGILLVNSQLPSYSLLKRLTAVWAGAQAGLLPVFIAHLKPVPVASLPANIVAVPLLGPAVLLSITAGVISHVSVPAGKLFAALPAFYTRLVMMISSSLSSIPQASFSWLFPGVSLIVFISALFIMVVKLKNNESVFKACALMVCALLILNLPGHLVFRHDGRNRLIFFDVGQGDSILVQDKSGNTVLVDGGPESEIILEKLRSNGIRKLDLVVLTHPHQDHLGGLVGVLKEIPIGRILLPDVEEGLSGSWTEFKREAERKGIKKTVAEAGQYIEISPDLTLNVLYPTDSIVLRKEDLNNGSTVILCDLDGVRTLLMGDLEIEGQKSLMKYDSNLDCDILKVPHQGSKDAALREFIDRSMPEMAVISVGENNEYGHPSRIFTNLLQSEGVKTFRTDKMGDIVMSIKEETVSVQTGRSGL